MPIILLALHYIVDLIMIANRLATALLLATPRYSVSLSASLVSKHFDNNFKKARESLNKIAGSNSLSPIEYKKLFVAYPLAFKEGTPENQRILQRIEYLKGISEQDGPRAMISRKLMSVMFKNRALGFRASQEFVDEMIDIIEKAGFTQSQLEALIQGCPNVFHLKFPVIFKEKLTLFSEYLDLSTAETLSLFECAPYLLPCSARMIEESIKVLHRSYKMSKREIFELGKVVGEVLTFGQRCLEDILKTPIKWGLDKDEAKVLFQTHPILFFNYPYDVMPLKRRILKYLNFTAAMGKKMMQDHPEVLIWSVRSLEAKAIFLRNRLQFELDENTIQLLGFNFNKTIRPRGEMLVRSKHKFERSNMVELMKLSDEEFVSRLGIKMENLVNERAKYPISDELDFRRNKSLQNGGTNDKIRRFAEAYRKD